MEIISWNQECEKIEMRLENILNLNQSKIVGNPAIKSDSWNQECVKIEMRLQKVFGPIVVL